MSKFTRRIILIVSLLVLGPLFSATSQAQVAEAREAETGKLISLSRRPTSTMDGPYEMVEDWPTLLPGQEWGAAIGLIPDDTGGLWMLFRSEPPINYVNAEGNFYINQNKIKLTGKNILIVATDGCFGYFPSPIHFEYSLLKSLSESTSIEAWQKMISQDIKNVTKDDATMSLIAFGWDNFLEIKGKSYIHALKNIKLI